MDLFVFLSHFLYRIRYKLIFGTVLAVALAWWLSDLLPHNYNVTTTIFTGITSKTTVDDGSGRTDWNQANNAHENILNLIRSKNTLEAVSISLLAQHLMYGNAEKDNMYILANHYRNLMRIVPKKVLDLVDKDSLSRTIANFHSYKGEGKGNFIYELFNWDNPYYGYIALSKIKANRRGASDMIEISYDCDDPGIAANTLHFLSLELKNRYESLLLSTSMDVISYFERKLKIDKEELDRAEDSLVNFNMLHDVINYEEQSKALTVRNNDLESRLEQILLVFNNSQALLRSLDKQMDTRTKLMLSNETFLNSLSKVSSLSGQIAEIEVFGANESRGESLTGKQKELKQVENDLKNITDTLDLYKYSKQGVVIQDIVTEWLSALLSYERSKAELDVIRKRREELMLEFKKYTPVGPNLGRRDRDVRIKEETYLNTLNYLGAARLRQKNILLDAGTLQMVTAPDFPLLSKPRGREVIVLAAFFGVIIFIIGFYLLLELIDRTLRDGMRTARLTGGRVIGAFPTTQKMKYRNYDQEVRRIASAYLGNILNSYMGSERPMVVSLISIEDGEGKSYVAENLEQYWVERGVKVAFVSLDSTEGENYTDVLRASSIYDLPSVNSIGNVDVILVEYRSLGSAGIAKSLLAESDVNLLILRADRAWHTSDKLIFENLQSVVTKDKIFLYLNNADREAVEDYTGQLPPHTFLRRLSYRLVNFGITAKS